MQFLQPTFDGVLRAHPLPPGGSSPPSPYNPSDAIHAAAYLLCDNGARDGRDIPTAIWNYNHDQAYVARVLELARRYASTPPAATPTPSTSTDPSAAGSPAAAEAAINFARSQLGQPYQWGGNGPTAGEGFDCSGLTHAAYQAAGIALPRTADTQLRAGPRLDTDQPLQPGDLVFYGTPTKATHVALYIGSDRVIHAPSQNNPVQEAPLPRAGYLGATRPTGTAPPAIAQDAPVPMNGTNSFTLISRHPVNGRLNADQAISGSMHAARMNKFNSVTRSPLARFLANRPVRPDSSLSLSAMAQADGLGQQWLGRNPTHHEQQVAADLDHLGLQVTPQNVLHIRNILMGAAEHLQDVLYRNARRITVGPPGGDPISQPAADELNRRSQALIAQYEAHVSSYQAAGESLRLTARAYGYAEQAITDSFNSHMKSYRQSRVTP